MGQKVNPYGFRLGITTDHVSRWFSDSTKPGQRYADYVAEDVKIRKLLQTQLDRAGVSGIEVAYLSASEIADALKQGAIHFGVTGEDLLSWQLLQLDGLQLTLAPGAPPRLAVRDALLIVGDNEGIGISRRRITLSTSGVVPMMARAGEEIGVNLAVSLHGATQEDGPRPGDGQQHGEDRGVGRGGGHGDHHGVREHHERRRRGATARAVAQLQHLGDREHLQRLDARREEEAQHCEPGGDGHHEPHPGDPVLVAQPHTAHGGGTAQHHGSHGGGVEARTQTTPGHAVVRGGARTACGPQPDHHHRGQVQHDHEHVHGGSPRAGGRVPRVLIRLRFRAGAWR